MIKFKKLPFKIDQVFLSSDIHGFHKNICKGTSTWGEDHSDGCRDFKDEVEMTEHITSNINNMVGENDLLIHCGDWSFGGKDNISKLRSMINCRNVIELQGNHDHLVTENDTYQRGVETLKCWYDYTQIGFYQVESIKFVCCHYPFSIWYQSHHNISLFYGHVHGSFENVGKSLDVGVDNIFKLKGKYQPISLKEANNICMKKEVYLESHHQEHTN